jgi:hypothetical protein
MTPFDDARVLLVDGNNLLHRISGGVEGGALRLLLAKLSGAIPATISTVVVLDGHAAPGTDRRQKIRGGLDVQHAGSISADDAVLNMIRDAAVGQRHAIVVVSDDRPLTDKARHLGARTRRLEWLQALIDRPVGQSAPASIGRKGIRPEREEPEREPWQPGRGATRKKGNPRREKH